MATPSAVADSLGTIQRVKPSILAVGTYQSTRTPRFQFRGTGFVVENGTLVVTNAHVIPTVIEAEKREVLVVVVPGKGHEAEVRPVTVVATDRRYDLSILKLQGLPLPALKLGDSASVVEGERYLFTGFPIGAAIGLFPATHHCIVSALTPVAIPLSDSSQLDARTVRQLSAEAYSIFQLDGTAYRIIPQLRYVKAHVHFPGESTPLVLHGAINWVQYDNKESPPVCTYGIAFSENKPQELVALQRCLERFGRQGTEPAAARRPDVLDLD